MTEPGVLLLVGGVGAEREVSLATGEACRQALESLGFPLTVYDDRGDFSGLVAALSGGADVVLNCLHGGGVEGGQVQAVCDVMKVRYSHSGMAGSALAMDKRLSRMLFRAHGLTIAEGVALNAAEVAALDDWPLAPPVVVKPIAEGSSVGVSIHGQEASFVQVRAELVRLSQTGDLLIEAFVPGRELTCGVLERERVATPLAVTELMVDHGFYDYRAKYDARDGAVHCCPADIPVSLEARVKEASVSAHRILGLRGVSRSDFRYDPETDRLVILETNAQPGMTATSLLPEQAAHCGLDFPTLVRSLVMTARHD